MNNLIRLANELTALERQAVDIVDTARDFLENEGSPAGKDAAAALCINAMEDLARYDRFYGRHAKEIVKNAEWILNH